MVWTAGADATQPPQEKESICLQVQFKTFKAFSYFSLKKKKEKKPPKKKDTCSYQQTQEEAGFQDHHSCSWNKQPSLPGTTLQAGAEGSWGGPGIHFPHMPLISSTRSAQIQYILFPFCFFKIKKKKKEEEEEERVMLKF